MIPEVDVYKRQDLQPAAIKIGMVHNAAIVHTIAECLQNIRSRFVVYDLSLIHI